MDFSVLTINLKMKNCLDKSCRKHQNILCVVHFTENRALYEKRGKNIVESERPQMTV
jgi:hypothetical protein